MLAESVAASIVAPSGGEAQDGSHGGRTLGGQEPQIFQDEPVSQLEMIEAQLLSHASLDDFRIVGAPRQVGDVSAVLEATCGLPGLPRPMKRYALKVMAAFKSNEGEADDGFGSSIPSSVYQQFPSVPPTLVREWFLSNTLPPHPNVARTVRIGSYDLSGFDGLQLAEAIGSEELRRVATADKVRATKGKKSLSASLVSVLQSLSSAIKATVGKALADNLVNDGKESDVPTSSTALPGLAFAVSDCATASLASIRHSLPQPLPFQVLFPIALQLSRALAHINNYRVAHRDLHPGNVLVFPGTLGNNATGSAMLGGGVGVSVASSSSSSAGSTTTTITNTAGSSSPIPRYCLADFGSAVKLESDSMSLPYQHHSQPIGGALAFLPPEVLVAAAKGAAATGWKPSSGGSNGSAFAVNGKKVTSIPYGKSDVWGLGALLYSIAFGSHPWPGYPASLSSTHADGASNALASSPSSANQLLLSNPLLSPPQHLSGSSSAYPLYFRELLSWALRPNPSQRLSIRAFALRCEELACGVVPRPLPTRFFPWSVGAAGGNEGLLEDGSSAASTGGAVAVASDGSSAAPSEAELKSGAGAGWSTVAIKSALDGAVASIPIYLGAPKKSDGEDGSMEGRNKEVLQGIASGSNALDYYTSQWTYGDLLQAAVEMLPSLKPSLLQSAAVNKAKKGKDKKGGSDSDAVASAANGANKASGSAASHLEYSLFYNGLRIDEGIPISKLPKLAMMAAVSSGASASALVVAAVPSTVLPRITLKGYGTLAPAAPPPSVTIPLIGALGSAVAAPAGGAASALAPLAGAAAGTVVGTTAGAVAGAAGSAAVFPASAGAGGAAPTPALAPAPAPAKAASEAAVATAPVKPTAIPAAPVVKKDIPPLYAFDGSRKSKNIELSHSDTVAATSDKWGTVLLNAPTITSRTHANGARYSFSVMVLQIDNGAGCAVGFADVSGVKIDPLTGGSTSATAFDPLSHNLGAHPGSWAYSKTGKISNGVVIKPAAPPPGSALPAPVPTVWAEYGEGYSAGDIITCEVEPASGRIRFFKNWTPQGTAFIEQDIRSAQLRPAVCIGSNGGGKYACVQLVTPPVREFDRNKSHHRIQFSEDGASVLNPGKWATSLASHPGILHGKVQWSVRLEDTRHGAGVAIGVVDAENFDWEKQNLGASGGSWCFSKTGKIGDGSGFTDYGRPFSCGDVVTVILDMDSGTLSFAVNGEDQGIAYGPDSGLSKKPLVPAVCLGSTDGNKLAKVTILNPNGVVPLVKFDRYSCNNKLKLSDMFSKVETNDRWGTVFLDTPPVNSGKLSFAIHVTSAGQGCGAGIGFADPRHFKPQTRNLGAAEHSWCYSKTGKRSAGGAGFELYGASFKTGDVVTAEIDFDEDTMRFYVNGKDQGVAFGEQGFKDRMLVPAVVLGSSDGGHLTQLQLVPPAVTRLDPRRSNKHITLKNGDRVAVTEHRWSSALADHPGTSNGVIRFAVKVEGDGGAAVGFAEATAFRPYMHNLGASPGTWALSKTGKKSAGDAEGFTPYCEKLGSGDIIGCEADMGEGVIRFWRNGMHLGAAFTGLSGRGLTLVPAICIGSNNGSKLATVTLVEFEANGNQG